MKTITRIATWIDVAATTAIGLLLRGVTAAFAFVLRRGRHRPWRRGAERARRRSASRP